MAVAIAVRGARNGVWDGVNSLIEKIIALLPDTSVRDRLIAINSLGDSISLMQIAEQFGCSGYVVESVP